MMAKLKNKLKILVVLLAVLLFGIFFAGCADYRPAQKPSDPSGPEIPDKPGNPDDPENPGEQEDKFTVSLKLRMPNNSIPFTKEMASDITAQRAQWTEIDGTAVYSAYFDENGVATRTGLDGDYKISLLLTQSFRQKYTYDPDPIDREGAMEVNNDKRDADVELYSLLSFGRQMYCNGGTQPYFELTETGAYSVTLKSKEDQVLFYFKPKISGIYSFLTFVDTTADEINPIMNVYQVILPHVPINLDRPYETKDDGGAEGLFTKNVKWEYDISNDESSGSNGLAFLLYSTSYTPSAYPLRVDFILQRDGEFTHRDDYDNAEEVERKDFTVHKEVPDGTWTFFAHRPGVVDNILNEKMVAPNPDDNNYYYFVDEEGNFTDRLYAMLGGNNEVHSAFTDTRINVNYITEKLGKPAYNYYEFLRGANGYLASDGGGFKYLNANGAYPVNEELKMFLQRYALSQRLFYDGFGFAEMSGVDQEGNPNPAYNSDEESQWLYACGYYRK